MSAVITCPTWCEKAHSSIEYEGENPTHYKQFGDFGDTGGAYVEVWISFFPDGRIDESGFLFNIEESSDPEDMEEVAGWCTAAAAFMREIRGASVTV